MVQVRVPRLVLGHRGLAEILRDLPCYFLIIVTFTSPHTPGFTPSCAALPPRLKILSVPPKHTRYLLRTEMLFIVLVLLFGLTSRLLHLLHSLDVQTPDCAHLSARTPNMRL